MSDFSKPHIVLYVADGIYDSGAYKTDIPETFDGFTVGVEPERNGIKLLMAVWQYTEDE